MILFHKNQYKPEKARQVLGELPQGIYYIFAKGGAARRKKRKPDTTASSP
jgi:hypothetical protein